MIEEKNEMVEYGIKTNKIILEEILKILKEKEIEFDFLINNLIEKIEKSNQIKEINQQENKNLNQEEFNKNKLSKVLLLKELIEKNKEIILEPILNTIKSKISQLTNTLEKNKNNLFDNQNELENLKEKTRLSNDNSIIIDKLNELIKSNQNLNDKLTFPSTSKLDIIYSFNYYSEIEILINKNEKNKRFDFIIINNGFNQWKENKTFLKMKENQYFTSEIIKLNPLKINEKQQINCFIKEKDNLKEQRYTLLFDFFVEDKQYGEAISIDIELLDL